MKLKRFIAPDTNKAMRKVKETFGPDAVILSSHTVKGGVEVVAAVDYDEEVINQSLAGDITAPDINTLLQTNETSSSPSVLEGMRNEIQLLREIVENQLSGFAWQNISHSNPLQLLLLKRLANIGVDVGVAENLVKDITSDMEQQVAWHHVLNNMMQHIQCTNIDIIDKDGIHVFVGPTGVGKTTTIAKLAARFALRHGAENLGLVTMDSYRIAAHEQLITYGKILGINVCTADDEASLHRVLNKLQHKKLVLIDSAGVNPHDERIASQFKMLQDSVFPINVSLVLAATAQSAVLKNVMTSYKRFHIDNCILTKLDEAVNLGAVLSVFIEEKLPLSYLTDGQRVPEDIKQANTQHLLQKIIYSAALFNKEMKTHELASGLTGRPIYAE